jgi:hypothetical protein
MELFWHQQGADGPLSPALLVQGVIGAVLAVGLGPSGSLPVLRRVSPVLPLSLQSTEQCQGIGLCYPARENTLGREQNQRAIQQKQSTAWF